MLMEFNNSHITLIFTLTIVVAVLYVISSLGLVYCAFRFGWNLHAKASKSNSISQPAPSIGNMKRKTVKPVTIEEKPINDTNRNGGP